MRINSVISSNIVEALRLTVVLKSKQLNTVFLRCQFLASERQNLHDGLYLTDPSVTSFDEESLLNAHGSDEVNDQLNREILLRII